MSYSDHDDFAMHVAFAGIAGAREEGLEEVEDSEAGEGLQEGPDEGDGVEAVEEARHGHVDGHGGGLNGLKNGYAHHLTIPIDTMDAVPYTQQWKSKSHSDGDCGLNLMR